MYTNKYYEIMATADKIGLNSTYMSATWQQMEEDGWTHTEIAKMMRKKIELKQN